MEEDGSIFELGADTLSLRRVRCENLKLFSRVVVVQLDWSNEASEGVKV